MKKNQVLLLASLLLLGSCTHNESSSSSNLSDDSTTSSESSASSDVEPAKTFAINAPSGDGYTINAPSTGVPGSTISFSVSALTGYTISSVSVVTDDGTDVAIAEGSGGTYTFTMPSKAVSVAVFTTINKHALSITDTKEFITAATFKKLGSTNIENIDTSEESVDIEFGATISLSFKTISGYTLTSVDVKSDDGTVNHKIDSTMKLDIAMPDSDAEIIVKYQNEGEDEGEEFTLTVNKSDNCTTTKFFDEQKTEISKAKAYTTVYVQLEFTEGYALSKLEISYSPSYETTGTLKKDDITSSKGSGTFSSYYMFTMPSLESGTSLTLNITDKNTTAYADEEFVGDYLIVNLSNQVCDVTDFGTDVKAFSIDGSGLITMNRGTDNITTAQIAGDDNGIISWNGASFAYGNNLLFGDSYMQNPWSSASYLSFFVKKASGTSASDYHVYAESFKVDDSPVYSIQVLKGTDVYATAFIDAANKIGEFGVTFTFLRGENVSDANAIYEVHKNDTDKEYLKTVGYINEGGAANRNYIEYPYGEFSLTSDSSTKIFLDGNGVATYKDATYSYVISEGVITLSAGSSVIKGTIDIAGKTIIITSEETVTTLPFKGHLYGGSYYSNWDEGNRYFYIQFDATANTFKSAERAYKNDDNPFVAPTDGLKMNGTSSNFEVSSTSYTYSEDTGVLTASLIDSNNQSGKTFTMKYNVSTDIWTISDNWGYNLETTKGATLKKIN